MCGSPWAGAIPDVLPAETELVPKLLRGKAYCFESKEGIVSASALSPVVKCCDYQPLAKERGAQPRPRCAEV